MRSFFMMSSLGILLDNFVANRGCALLYSTHQRSTADLLRGWCPDSGHIYTLSKRDHRSLQIPRIVNENCLHGLRQNSSEQPSSWSAVLRGRVPALVQQNATVISTYAEDVFQDVTADEERKACLTAVITGEIGKFPNAPNLFRAYSYMSERFVSGGNPLFAWPLFMLAQSPVIGKKYRRLCATMENPDIDEPKAFEAIVQLSVLIRLLSEQEHHIVLSNPKIRDAGGSAFKATEMFDISANVTTLTGLVEAVTDQYSVSPSVMQVVAVPMFSSFPTYDFFLLHRNTEGWEFVVGYQCKQGTDNPSEDACAEVPKSVWIEGRCRKYRVQGDDNRVANKEHRGWILLGESNQDEFWGVSVSEALPQDSICESNPCCMAEKALYEKRETGKSEQIAKKARTVL